MFQKIRNKKGGFTLIELLIVIGIIAVLAGVVLIIINPGKQFGKANDSERKAEISGILNGFYQYQTSPTSRGALPECNINAVATAIPVCDTDVSGVGVGNGAFEGAIELGNVDAVGIYNCDGILTPNFVREMPIDPAGTVAASDYHICQVPAVGNAPLEIFVIAPGAEVFNTDVGCEIPGTTTQTMCISG